MTDVEIMPVVQCSVLIEILQEAKAREGTANLKEISVSSITPIYHCNIVPRSCLRHIYVLNYTKSWFILPSRAQWRRAASSRACTALHADNPNLGTIYQ